jgi:hypothetical protein
MKFFSRLRTRLRWRKETKERFAQIKMFSRESVAGLRELASLRVRLDRLFVRWQLADLVGDEKESTKVVIEIVALQDRRDLLLKRENDLQFAIAQLQGLIQEKTWEVRTGRSVNDPYPAPGFFVRGKQG